MAPGCSVLWDDSQHTGAITRKQTLFDLGASPAKRRKKKPQCPSSAAVQRVGKAEGVFLAKLLRRGLGPF
jgi:hypothetical protein